MQNKQQIHSDKNPLQTVPQNDSTSGQITAASVNGTTTIPIFLLLTARVKSEDSLPTYSEVTNFLPKYEDVANLKD
jgi:hypothetical protein